VRLRGAPPASDQGRRRDLPPRRRPGLPLRAAHGADRQRHDNGTAFTFQPRYRSGPTALYGGHPFDRVGRAQGIRPQLTRPDHPWTNGQAERLNRTVKDATVKAYHYATHAALEAHVRAFLAAYNVAEHLKALRWRTPFRAVRDAWADDPQPFRLNPHHLMPEPNSRRRGRAGARTRPRPPRF
jgi:hypothetical protein